MPFSMLIAFAIAMISAVLAFYGSGEAASFALVVMAVSMAIFVAGFSMRRIRRPCV